MVNFGVGMVSSGVFLVAVVFVFHCAFVLLHEMGWGLGRLLLLRGCLNLLWGVGSFMLLVSMGLVGYMLLVCLVSLLVTSMVLAWVLVVGVGLVLVLLGVHVHTSNDGAVINEHPLSVFQVDKSVEFVGLRQPHVVVSLQLRHTLLLSLLCSGICVGNLLLVRFLWSGVMSLVLRELVVLFGVTMHATLCKCLSMVKSSTGELLREVIRAHSLGVSWCINILKVRCSHMLCLLLMRWLNGMRSLLVSLLSFLGFNDLLMFWMELLH